jgi:hypothetical protein
MKLHVLDDQEQQYLIHVFQSYCGAGLQPRELALAAATYQSVANAHEEMEVLFTLLSERYERGSVLLTSNLPFSKWEGIFKDPMTTAAAIDRLVHHSVIVELNIPSYRMEEAKKNRDPVQESNAAN